MKVKDLWEGRVAQFTLPLKLETLGNAKGHWRPKAKQAKEQREAAKWEAWAHGWPSRAGLDKRPLLVTITRVGPRDLDSDNLAGCAKHVRDGIADALGVNDRDPRVEWRVEQRRGKPREYACEVRIEARSQTQEQGVNGDVKQQGGL